MTIKDGTGTDYRAKVNSNHELHTRARSIDHAALKCVDGNMFLLSLPFMNITTTGGRIAWMLFSDPINYLVLDKLIPSWNGGNSSSNKALQVEYVIGDTAPTTNTQPWAIANSNLLSTNTLTSTIKIWNGTGDGMTGHTPGVTAGRMIVGQGYTITPVEGKMIVGPNMTLSINYKAEEAGVASFTGYFYLYDPSEA